MNNKTKLFLLFLILLIILYLFYKFYIERNLIHLKTKDLNIFILENFLKKKELIKIKDNFPDIHNPNNYD